MVFELDAAAGDATLLLQNALYPKEAIAGAAHAFSKRAAVYVDDESQAGETIVTLEIQKGPAGEAALKQVAGDFLNELLNQVIGKLLLADNAKLTSLIITKALMSARRDDADPLQPPAAEDEGLTGEQRAEAKALLEKAETDFAAMQKGLGG